MLYGRIKTNIEESVLVFVHIPKTGGSSFKTAVQNEWGSNAVVQTRMQKHEKIYRSRFHILHTHTRSLGSLIKTQITGSHPLWPRNFDNNRKANIRMITGHFRLGDEPKIGKKPLYTSIVRDPIDRFISEYYYLGHQIDNLRKGDAKVNPKTNALFNLDIDDYAKWCFEKGHNAWNIQCQYLSRSKYFSEAKKAVDSKIFLCAPLKRYEDFLYLVSKELNIQYHAKCKKENIGLARPKMASLKSETVMYINHMYDQDKLLYSYVSKQFDELFSSL